MEANEPPIPKKRTQITPPIPKKRKSLSKAYRLYKERKALQRKLKKNDERFKKLIREENIDEFNAKRIQREFKKNDINIKEDKTLRQNLMFLFSEDITNYEITNFRDIENEMRNNLSNHRGVKLMGKIYDNGDLLLSDYEVTFSNINQFEQYIRNQSEKYDLDSWEFEGSMVLIQQDKFTNHNRSQRGMGINSNFIISEYKGKNCYIPSQDKCFLKCYCYLKNKELSNIESEFEKFLFNTQAKNRKGVMTNAKISKFNNCFNESLQYYNPKDRHLYPKLKEKSDNKMVLYLHFDNEKTTIGHYCLINKEEKQLGIQEIKNNFKKIGRESIIIFQ